MNVAVLNGRLTKDPEVRQTQSGMVVTAFSIAVDRTYKREGQPDVDFFNCTAFGKTGETIGRFFTKGRMIIIEGSLQNDTYTNKDGRKITSTGIVVNAFSFCDKQAQPQAQPQAEQAWMDIPDSVDDEELPFN